VDDATGRTSTRKIGIVVVHGVADTEQGANLRTLVGAFCKNEPPPFEAVYRVEEVPSVSEDPIPSSGNSPQNPEPKSTVPVTVMRCLLEGNVEAIFAEVYWADTTRVTTNKLAALLAGFGIVFESHHFIDALIDRSKNKSLVNLVHLAGGLIRGPIAGINVALLTISAIYLYGQAVLRLSETEAFRKANPDFRIIYLDKTVLIICVMLFAFFSVWAYRSQAAWRLSNRSVPDLAAMEVRLWSAAGGGLGAVLVLLGMTTTILRLPTEASGYADLIYYPIAVLWAIFCLCLLVAFVMILRAYSKTSDERVKRSLWLAFGVVILQSALWILFMSVPAVPLLGLAEFTGVSMKRVPIVVYGFALNCLSLAIIMIVVIYVSSERKKITEDAKTKIDNELANVLMPRLIVHKSILCAIISIGMISVVANLAANVAMLTGYDQGDLFKHNIYLSLAITSVVTLASLALYAVLDTPGFVNVVHIARDLIHHQYKPNKLTCRLFSGRELKATYPRRSRLQSRVDSVVQMLGKYECGDIVFVAHSQGSVIVYEYLKDTFIPERTEAKKGVSPIIPLVTFGSGLSHLYDYYFRGYSSSSDGVFRLGGVSWINLYRINDPIGKKIKVDKGAVTNVVMQAGPNGEGHRNYWGEGRVAQKLRESLGQLGVSITP
jgi:hypothetical protein